MVAVFTLTNTAAWQKKKIILMKTNKELLGTWIKLKKNSIYKYSMYQIS